MASTDLRGCHDDMECVLLSERARLVRLCARLSGNADAAEDLAQETMIEAWRNADNLRDESAYSAWLSGIARNVCLRWTRRHAREAAHRAHVTPTGPDGAASLDGWFADDTELDVELERDELATLLDRALALLPPETRDVLIGRYIEESPYAEIAQRLGLSEGTVAVRLHRGKLALRRVLTTELRLDAAAYGLIEAGTSDWRETRVWCPECGGQRLLIRFQSGYEMVSFRCPSCDNDPEVPRSSFPLENKHFRYLIGGLTRPRPILNRTHDWVHTYFRDVLADGRTVCTNCGRRVDVYWCMPHLTPSVTDGQRGVHVHCEACETVVSSSSAALMVALPQVQRFWREHSRIRTLPDRPIDRGGRASVVTRFEAVTSGAGLDVVSLLAAFEVVHVH